MLAHFEADGDLGGRVQAGLREVEDLLGTSLEFPDAFAQESAQHLLKAGGKRIRPLVTLLSAELADGVTDEVVLAAAVVELTHLATLYHDDVMDSAATRRGGPTAHQVWGNTVAILTGDMLFARASQLVAKLGPDAVRVQAETFERLCLGQLHETVGPGTETDPVAHYLQVIADKTGSLIGTSGYFGARCGGCPEPQVEAVRLFCEQIGLAFQLADDVIDVTSSAEVLGKTPGTDLREGVPTLPVLYARRDAKAGDADAQEVVALLDADLADDAALKRAVAALRESAATEQARVEAQRVADEAAKALTVVPDCSAKTAMLELADALVSRDT